MWFLLYFIITFILLGVIFIASEFVANVTSYEFSLFLLAVLFITLLIWEKDKEREGMEEYDETYKP